MRSSVILFAYNTYPIVYFHFKFIINFLFFCIKIKILYISHIFDDKISRQGIPKAKIVGGYFSLLCCKYKFEKFFKVDDYSKAL
jgi:hypothetical protein